MAPKTTPLPTARNRRSLVVLSAGPFVLVSALLAGITIYASLRVRIYGFDFRGGAWPAGRDILSGRSPYLTSDPATLLAQGNSYIPPPTLAVLCVPLSLLPFAPAVAVWGLLCTAAFVLALRIAGVRDWRVYGLAVTSFPFVASIGLGQPDGLLALGVVLAWRYRSSWRGAAAVGMLIAIKLLAWPLLIWLVATRRFKQAGVATTAAVIAAGGSWSLIGFKGLPEYARLLAADARAFAVRSHSVEAGALRLGTTTNVARLLAILVALAIAGAVARLATDRDRGLFAAALCFGLFVSPILWTHYLVILFVPLAISRRRADAAWLLTIAYWLSPLEPPPHTWQILFVLSLTAALAILSGRPLPMRARTKKSMTLSRALHPARSQIA